MSSPVSVGPVKKEPSMDAVDTLSPYSNLTVDTPKTAVDFVDSASSDKEVYLSTQSPRVSLPTPNLSEYEVNLRLIEALHAYHNLQLTDRQAYLEQSKRYSAYVEDQARLYSQLIEKRKTIDVSVQKDFDQLVSELGEDIEGIDSLIDEQNALNNDIQKGNSEEQEQYSALDKAYNEYVEQLQALSAISATGEVTPPSDPKKLELYQKGTQAYQNALQKFNTYFAQRKQEINTFNQRSISYNNYIQAYNQSINEALQSRGLSQYSNLMTSLNEIPLRNTTDVTDWQAQMNAISSPPFILNSPTETEKSIAQRGVSPLTIINQPSLDTFEANRTTIIQTLKEATLNAIDQQIKTLPFLQYLVKKQKEELTDSHETFVDQLKKSCETQITEGSASSIGSATLSEIIEGYSPALHALMGQLVTEKVIKENGEKAEKTKALENKDRDLEAHKSAVTRLNEDLPALSLALMSSMVGESLLRGLTAFKKIPVKQPLDSNGANIAFSSSLLTSALNSIENKSLHRKIADFLTQHPSNQYLSPSEKETLISSSELGVLLSLGKLVESSLGIDDLIMPPAEQQASPSIAGFITQGFSPEEASFLAIESQKIIAADSLQPKIEGSVDLKNIDIPLAQTSLKAALVCNHMDVKKADFVAKACIQDLCDGKTHLSSKEFSQELSVKLKDYKVDNASEIATTIPLVFTPMTLETEKSKKTSQETASLIESRVVQVVSPEKDSVKVQELAKNCGDLLERAPVNFRQQVSLLRESIDSTCNQEAQQTFEAAQSPAVSTVLVKLLDPAKMYLRYAGGPSYDIKGIKQPIEVPI